MDLQKVWETFSAADWFEHMFPTPQMQAVIKAEVIDKLPEYAAHCLGQKVTEQSLLETWLAYTTHYVAAKVYEKILTAAPDGLPSKPATPEEFRQDVIEGEQAMAKDIVALHLAVSARQYGVALRAPTRVEAKAADAIAQMRATGVIDDDTTIAQLAERFPLALLQMG